MKNKVAMPDGYRLDWGGEYTEYTASRAQMNVILPLTLLLIFMLLFVLYSNFKFPFITVLGVLLSAPAGGIVALDAPQDSTGKFLRDRKVIPW